MLMNFKKLQAPVRTKYHHCAKFEELCPSRFRETFCTKMSRRYNKNKNQENSDEYNRCYVHLHIAPKNQENSDEYNRCYVLSCIPPN